MLCKFRQPDSQVRLKFPADEDLPELNLDNGPFELPDIDLDYLNLNCGNVLENFEPSINKFELCGGFGK